MTPDEYSVTLAVENDIEALSGMIAFVFSLEKDFSVDRQKQLDGLKLLLANGNSRVFVLKHKNVPVGMCTAQLLISTAEGGYKALIEDVAVAPECRGRGLGRKLLKYVSDWAKTVGVKRLDLAADADNASASAFYREMGWTKTNLIVWQNKGSL